MFDVKKFQKAKFEHRTEKVPVPEFAEFFSKGEDPVWEVRSLTGKEYFQVEEAKVQNDNRKKLIERLSVGKATKESIDAALAALNIITKDVSSEVAMRVKLLELGSVSPECDTELALKVLKVHKDTFKRITEKIHILSGKGMEPGKPKGSTQTPK